VQRRRNSNSNSTALWSHFIGDGSLNSSRKSKPPHLELPSFCGNYADWPDLYAMLSTVVSNDQELSKIEKFEYLRASLEGVALQTIRSLEPSDANYNKELSINRFDNKLLHFRAHVKAIFGLKGVEMGSAAGLCELSDKMNSHLRAIRTLATTDQILVGFMINIVSSKLNS